MSDSKTSVNFSANTVDGLIMKDNIKYHEKIDKCTLSTAFKEVTKTEARNMSLYFPPSDKDDEYWKRGLADSNWTRCKQ